MSKLLRSDYFRLTPLVRETRHLLGKEAFDTGYRAMYEYLASLCIGQWFSVPKVCRRNPENHDLVVLYCDIYHNMDFNVNLEWDPQQDRITVLPTALGQTEGRYSPPDIYSRIVAAPSEWGVDPDDLW